MEQLTVAFTDGRKTLRVNCSALAGLFTPILVQARQFLMARELAPPIRPAFIDSLDLLQALADELSRWAAGALQTRARARDLPYDELTTRLEALERSLQESAKIPEQEKAPIADLLTAVQQLLNRELEILAQAPENGEAQDCARRWKRAAALYAKFAQALSQTDVADEAFLDLLGRVLLIEVGLAGTISPGYADAVVLALLTASFDPEAQAGVVVTLPWVSARTQQSAARFQALTVELIERLTTDWDDLRRFFFEGAELQLDAIQTTGGDPHKGGHVVQKLILRAREEPAVLIYKPSDIEPDYLLVGDSRSLVLSSDPGEQQRAYQPSSRGTRIRSFLELLNELLRVAGNTELQLPLYKILPRYPGSRLESPPDGGPLPVGRSYGYEQYITPDSSPLSPQAGRQWGCYEAMAVAVSLSDMHDANRIVSGGQPYLIDLENVGYGPCTAIAQTGLNGSPIGSLKDNKDGFRWALRALRCAPERIWAWLARLASCIARLVAVPTGSYEGDQGVFLRMDQRELDAHVVLRQAELQEEWRKAHAAAPDNPWQAMPAFATYTYRHAFLDLMEDNIPMYLHRLSERELLDARGEPVRVDWPRYDRPRPASYFPTPTFQILQAQLETLLTQDIDTLVERSFGSR